MARKKTFFWKVLRYFSNILMSLDQLANVILGGDPDETISSRIGKVKVHYGGKIPWRMPVLKLLDLLLEKIDPGHSVDAIEEDEGKRELWDWTDED